MHSRKHEISTPVDPNIAAEPFARPDPEVVPGAKRRTFSKAEKLRILAAADACTAPGEIGALLRREGIYSSHLATWRKQRQAAAASQPLERKRGPKADATAAQERKVRDLENEVARLRDKLAKADLIIDVQKKLSTLLGLSSSDTPSEPK
jgi:transposase-like protein